MLTPLSAMRWWRSHNLRVGGGTSGLEEVTTSSVEGDEARKLLHPPLPCTAGLGEADGGGLRSRDSAEDQRIDVSCGGNWAKSVEALARTSGFMLRANAKDLKQ